MKKILMVMAAFAALFAMNACVNEEVDNEVTCYGFVTVDKAGYLYPDLAPGLTLSVAPATMTAKGIDKYERMFMIYKVNKNDQWKYGSTANITPNITSCYAMKVLPISERPDTLGDYTARFSYFNAIEGTVYTESQYFVNVLPGYPEYLFSYPGIYVDRGYINFFYMNETTGNSVLTCDSVNALKSTAYLTYRTKTGLGYNAPGIQSYSLKSSSMIKNLPGDMTDSITVVVRANTAVNGKGFGYTVRCKKNF